VLSGGGDGNSMKLHLPREGRGDARNLPASGTVDALLRAQTAAAPEMSEVRTPPGALVSVGPHFDGDVRQRSEPSQTGPVEIGPTLLSGRHRQNGTEM